MMRARADATTALCEKLGFPLKCVQTGWEDASRCWSKDGQPCAYGSNIADVGLLFKNADGEPDAPGFKLRSENLNELLTEVDARRFKVVVCDKDGQNPRLEALSETLKHAGERFGHNGVPAGTNLYDPEVDDGKVKLRIELIFAPMGENQTAQFAVTKYSYQAHDGHARNLDLFSHPQGTTCSDDRTATKLLRPEAWDAETGKVEAYWFEAENTGKSLTDLGTETEAEAAAAVARGKGMAVRSGCAGWPKLPNVYYLTQVPLAQNQESLHEPLYRSAVDDWRVDSEPLYRSLGLEEEDATGVRISRGAHAGEAAGVLTKDVQRARGEPITVTASVVVAIGDAAAPSEKSVREAHALMEHLRYVAGSSKRLFDRAAGLAEGATKKPKGAPLVGAVADA